MTTSRPVGVQSEPRITIDQGHDGTEERMDEHQIDTSKIGRFVISRLLFVLLSICSSVITAVYENTLVHNHPQSSSPSLHTPA